MPSSRFLISSQTLASSAASVTFSSIPATYTNLVVKMSMRGTAVAVDLNPRIRFNGDTASNYSYTTVRMSGSAASSNRDSNGTLVYLEGVNGASTTSNTFTSAELYIPSYTASQSKPFSDFHAAETNTTTIYNLQAQASLWRNNAAITSIAIIGDGDFASGSSFYLYGLKNS